MTHQAHTAQARTKQPRTAQPSGVRPRVLSLLAAVLLAITGLLGSGPAAHAEDAYKYWGYFQAGGDTWSFAQKGAAELVPADGSVEGWRYGAATSAAPRVPRATATFDQVCGGATPENGKKRVAVVIDQGTPDDAPQGQQPSPNVQGVCVLATPEATGAQVLAAAGPVRVEKGMTCGVNGYPQSGCSEKVQLTQTPTDEQVQLKVLAPVGGSSAGKAPGQTPAGQQNGPSTSTATIVMVALIAVVLVVGGIIIGARRRRQSA